MFVTRNIKLKTLLLITIIIRTMMTITITALYFIVLFGYMFISHLTEGIDGMREAIKIDEEDIKQMVTKK